MKNEITIRGVIFSRQELEDALAEINKEVPENYHFKSCVNKYTNEKGIIITLGKAHESVVTSIGPTIKPASAWPYAVVYSSGRTNAFADLKALQTRHKIVE